MIPTDYLKKILSYGVATGELAGRSVRDSLVYGIDSWNKEPEGYDNASFGDLNDIASRTGKGFCINGTHFLRHPESCYKNFICTGGTGSGKSTVVAGPTLLSANGPAIVCHDPSGQLLQWCGQEFINKGYSLYVLDFNDVSHSVLVNPLDFVRSPSEAGILASHLVRASMGTDAPDKFWERASSSLIRQLICLVLKMDAQYRNMANVRHLLAALAGEPKAVDKLMARHADNALFLEYKALIRGNEKTLSSIIMSAQAALSIWESDAVCRLTAKTTVDFKAFRSGKNILFLKNATFDAIYYRPLLSLIIENVIRIFMDRLPRSGDDHPVWFVLDETDTLQLKSLDTVLSNNRKYAMGFMLFYQSIFQLFKTSLDVGNTILGNCFSKLFLTGIDMKTASDLEQLIGRTTIIDNGKQRSVPLMPAHKIRMMQPDTALLIAGAHKPFLVHMTPFYRSPFLNIRIGQKQFAYSPDIPSSPVPLIPLA